jgi:hypothetical protein
LAAFTLRSCEIAIGSEQHETPQKYVINFLNEEQQFLAGKTWRIFTRLIFNSLEIVVIILINIHLIVKGKTNKLICRFLKDKDASFKIIQNNANLLLSQRTISLFLLVELK